MPNTIHSIVTVIKNHCTCDDNEIYIQLLNLAQHNATELDGYDFETDGDGDRILNELDEAIDEYEKSQREDEDSVENGDDDDDEIERSNEDLDDDEVPSQEKVT